MSEKRLIFVGSWQNNVIYDLITQISASSDVENVLVVVQVGDKSTELLDFDVNTCKLGASEASIKQLYDCQVTTLPYSILICDGKVKLESGIQLSQSELENSTEVGCDYFAKAIDSYNNFDLHLSAKWFHSLLLNDPNHQQGLFNIASILHMAGYPTLSVHYIERLLILNPDDVTAHSFLWALTSNPDCNSAVTINAYQRLAGLGDLRAITKLATLTGQGEAASRGDPSYARQIYEDMGEAFENKLVDRLGYRGPWLLFDMLEDVNTNGIINGNITVNVSSLPAEKGDWRVLDVGCGSGLVGRIFASYVANRVRTNPSTHLSLVDALSSSGSLMAGVDISPKMVEITLRGGGYDCAEAADLSQTLLSINSTDQSYERLDLIVAADTFIYIGALGDVFAEARKALRPHGLLMFSTEDLDTSPMRVQGAGKADHVVDTSLNGDNKANNDIDGAVPGWGCQLLRSARFAHSHRYIMALCERHNYRLVVHRETVLRTEETIPLGGNLYVLQKIEAVV